MNQPIQQKPADPVGADSFSYEAELSSTHPPAHPDLIPTAPDSKLARAEAMLNKALRAMIIFSGLMLAVLMFVQVVLRYGIESSFAGTEEAAILLGVWVYFLGMGYATRMREHIHGGIVSLVVKDAYKIRMIRLFGSIVCVIAACAFGFYAIKYALFIIDKGRMSLYLQWPKGLWSASMIAGFLMMGGYFLLQAYGEYKDIVKHHGKRQSEETK